MGRRIPLSFKQGEGGPTRGFIKTRTHVRLLWMKTQRTKHVTYKLGDHFVWCAKYRKRILTGKRAVFVEQEIRHFCEVHEWILGALNVQEDHIHLFLNAPPSVAPSQMAHTLKGATARRVFLCFPEVKKQLWGGALWSRSSSVGSVGDLSVETVLKYIELGQEEERMMDETFYSSFPSLGRGPAKVSTPDCL